MKVVSSDIGNSTEVSEKSVNILDRAFMAKMRTFDEGHA